MARINNLLANGEIDPVVGRAVIYGCNVILQSIRVDEVMVINDRLMAELTRYQAMERAALRTTDEMAMQERVPANLTLPDPRHDRGEAENWEPVDDGGQA